MVMWIRGEVGIDDQANDASRQPRSTASMTQPQSQPQYMVPRHYIDDPAPNSFRPSPSLGREEDQHTPIFSRHINFLSDALANGISLVSCVG